MKGSRKFKILFSLFWYLGFYRYALICFLVFLWGVFFYEESISHYFPTQILTELQSW